MKTKTRGYEGRWSVVGVNAHVAANRRRQNRIMGKKKLHARDGVFHFRYWDYTHARAMETGVNDGVVDAWMFKGHKQPPCEDSLKFT